METTYPQQAGLMADGKAAMELMGQWSAAVSRNNATTGEGLDHIGVFAFPAVEGGKGRRSDVMGGGNGYIVGKDAPDETLDFLNFILSEKAQRDQIDREGIIPVVKGMDRYLEGNTAEIAKIVANAGYYQLYYDQYLPLSVGEAVNNAATGLINETLTPEEAAEMVDNAWQEAK